MMRIGTVVVLFDGIVERNALVSAARESAHGPELDLVFVDEKNAAAGVDDGVLVATSVVHRARAHSEPFSWRWPDEEPSHAPPPPPPAPSGPAIPLSPRPRT
jgi:hypothetical protein